MVRGSFKNKMIMTKTVILGILICSIIYLLLDVLLQVTDQSFPTIPKSFVSGFIGAYITSLFVRKRKK